MRGISSPVLFELRAHEWRNAVDLRHLPEGTHSLAPRPGALAGGHSKLVGVGRLALPRLFEFESNRSAIPDEPHAGRRPGSGLPKSCQMVSQMSWFAVANCKAPGRLGDFKSPGSAVPAEASRREMVGMKGLAPPRLPDSESGPSAIRVEPHARELVHPAGLPPANSPFEAEDDNNFTTDAEMVGRHGAAPCSAV